MESYEMIENLAIYSDTVKYEGFSRIDILGQGGAKSAELVFLQEGYYKTTQTFTKGTQFRFVIGAGESSYVYSFAISKPARDNNFSSPVLMFPQTGISPLLNYRDSSVIIPAEDKTLALDDEAGMEFLITLYSKQPLDIQSVMRQFVSAKGSLGERLSTALDGNLLPSISYNKEASFTAQTDDSRAVAALVVAIEHR
jgi:hypothetical protein